MSGKVLKDVAAGAKGLIGYEKKSAFSNKKTFLEIRLGGENIFYFRAAKGKMLWH